MFRVGEKVVYPNHGVGIVERIALSAPDGGEKQTYYHLRVLGNDSKVMVPEENLERVGLRRLAGAPDIKDLLRMIADGNIDVYKDWKGRYKQNLEKMRTGILTDAAEVLKNLRLVSQKKSLSFREKKMYEKAKYFIVSEVLHVREISEEEAEVLVEKALASSIEKISKAKAS